MTFADAQRALAQFRDERNWSQYHTPEALARAISVEAGELNELFLWGRNPSIWDAAGEIADVMIYCLNLCNALGVDAGVVVENKIETNTHRVTIGDRLVP